jgi:pimeloyl-ACP methyl ester carboxylesterase
MPLLRSLSKNFLVIAPDLPGFGTATTPHTLWGFPEYAEYIDALLQSLGSEGVFVVGHSLGGGIALELAKRSALVLGLVLVSPAGRAITVSEFCFRWQYFFGKTLYDVSHYLKALPTLILLGWDFFGNRIRRGPEWRRVLVIARTCLFSSVLGLEAIHVPVLIVAPDQDELFSVEHLRSMAKTVPSAQVLVVRGNHDWILFRPILCASFVCKRFLNQTT